MGKPEPEYKPRIILQTKSYRVIAKPRPPFEGKARPDEINIEEQRNDGMGAPYWATVFHLWESRSGLSQVERFLQDLFVEVAAQPQHDPIVSASIYSIEERPKRGAKLAQLLTEVRRCLTHEVIITHAMPFDNRDNAVGIDLSPAIVGALRAAFPQVSEVLRPLELVRILIGRAAEELSK